MPKAKSILIPDVIFITINIHNSTNSAGFQRAYILLKEYDSILITTTSSKLEKIYDSRYVKVKKFLFLPVAFAYVAYYKYKNPRLIVYTQYSVIPAIIGGISKIFFSTKWIYDLWDHPSLNYSLSSKTWKGKLMKLNWDLLVSKILGRADVWIVSMSKSVISTLPQHSISTKIIYQGRALSDIDLNILGDVHHDSNLKNIKPILLDKKQPERTRFICSGSLTKERGVDSVVELILLLNTKGFDCELYIVGQLDLYAKQLLDGLDTKFSDRIFYLGLVDTVESLNLQRQCDFGICFLDTTVINYRYAFPIKVAEYLSCDLVPVCSRTSPIVEMLDDGRAGLFYDGTIESLTDKIIRYCENESSQLAMKNSIEKAKKQFDIKKLSSSIRSAIQHAKQ